MATKPKAILSTHDGREASPITKASNVLFENGQTAQDILNDRQDAMISPMIENSSSMFKVGQGDNVDYSANVVNGAYESMVLKGKSMVNCIQESSSQDVVLPYEFEEGRYVTINDTKESGALGVELKGQTLVNLSPKYNGKKTTFFSVDGSGFTSEYNNDYYKIIANGSNCNIALRLYTNANWQTTQPLKLNTTYLAIVDLDVQVSKNIYLHCGKVSYSGVYGKTIINGNGRQRVALKFTTPSEIDGTISIGTDLYSATGDYVVFYSIILIEYQEGMENWDIPYFQGMTSCKMPILHTVGKNLFDINKFISGKSIDDNGELINGSPHHYAIEEFIKIDNTITVSVVSDDGAVPDTANGTRLRFYDKNKKLISSNWFAGGVQIQNNRKKRTFTVNGAEYLRLNISASGGGADTSYEAMKTIQIENGSSMTSYEPHKSSILSLPEEVVLRSLPNGVCDTFNTRTGVYTQRIGELVFDGSDDEDWRLLTASSNWVNFSPSVCTFVFPKPSNCALTWGRGNNENSYLTNKFPAVPSTDPHAKEDKEKLMFDSTNIKMAILKTSLKTEDVEGLRIWLSQNPIVTQYELATPIITKINLSSTLKSWNTTTHIYSEIPENTLYPILSHSNPTYPVILKPSTKYSIVANSYSNNHTNSAINFNLGGATASTTVGNRVTTITTPSTLSNELLTMSGRGNKLNHVMVIEGDVVGDEPYFEGICDCKSPILSNVGKNLLDIKNATRRGSTRCNFINHLDGSVTLVGDGDGSGEGILTTTCYAHLKQGKTYTFSFESDGQYSGINGSDTVEAFLLKDGSTTIRVIRMNDFTTTFTCQEDGDYYVRFDVNKNNTTHKFWNIQLTEGATVYPYEPYKSNILSCNGDKIELTEDMFEQGTLRWTNIANGTSFEEIKGEAPNRIRTKGLIVSKPNTTYRIINDEKQIYQYLILPFDKNGCKVEYTQNAWVTNGIVTTTNDTAYIGIAIKKSNDYAIAPTEFANINFEIREVDKTIVLRSLPSGVCDTLNVETGEYVQRIGEVVKNNSTGFSLSTGGWENKTKVCTFEHFKPEGMKVQLANNKPTLNCDKVPSNTFSTQWSNSEGIESITQHNGGNIVLSIAREKLSTQDSAGLNLYLQSNPLTIQYELETPIVSTIDVQGFPYAYTNGHVQLSSGSIEQSLTPKVEYSVATNRNGQIRSNQKMVEKHQKELDRLQAIILANLINSQYQQTLTTLKYELSRV